MTQNNSPLISSLEELAKCVDYSLIQTLNSDPDSNENDTNQQMRQVFSGHYVLVRPTPIKNPKYVTHSQTFFSELGLSDSLATDPEFIKMFSGNISELPEPMRKVGWATGYALSIYGTEYMQQCPFQTGNGYGDGRAISILEAVLKGKRWEMQLKGGGPTAYCRGADGRAVLRSSVREFIAQEHMHALNIPTSRSLSLYTSDTEKVERPWYSEGSYSEDPDVLIAEAVAISTRVMPSFIRVGQLELFGRRARKNEYPQAKEELEQLFLHLIDREYPDSIPKHLSTPQKVILVSKQFCDRLISLVSNWIRVGFCQGNFNSDNCAAGGYTLDYGPFGFCDIFDPNYQSWTGGGEHFAFMNQPNAAYRNFHMFCLSMQQLLHSDQSCLVELNEILKSFPTLVKNEMDAMWCLKLGFHDPALESDKVLSQQIINELISLMVQTPVDYTIFFRELSSIPDDLSSIKKSFYETSSTNETPQKSDQQWIEWLEKWRSFLLKNRGDNQSKEDISHQMKIVNPKYILREWLLKPAYEKAAQGDYTAVHELQEVMTHPYDEQSMEIEKKYYKLKPPEFFDLGGVSHLSCSS